MPRITDLADLGVLDGSEVIAADDGTITGKTTTGALASLVATRPEFQGVLDAVALVDADRIAAQQARDDAETAEAGAAAAATTAISQTEINLATSLIQTQTILVAHIAAGN